MAGEWIPPDLITDFESMIDDAPLAELELRHPVGSDKFSPDHMEKSPSRPAIGLQGRILDAMDDGRLTVDQAHGLLKRLQGRRKAGKEAATHGG